MSAWDDLLERIDGFVTDGLPDDAERQLVPLVESAQDERSVDRELHAPDAARWIVGLILGRAALRHRGSNVDDQLDDADLKLILTRWLHPARPRV